MQLSVKSRLQFLLISNLLFQINNLLISLFKLLISVTYSSSAEYTNLFQALNVLNMSRTLQ